ncbi:SDR family oxidoreductase [Dietzia natronolimnaea]|uniref:SDR family oxidoreductase n=1 Tax=Dietzia natronolimnaea TaxID=161920 RepID=UPI003D0A3EE9
MGTEAGDVVAEREWSTGPVVITGASGQVGTALRARLAGLPNEVRALRRGDDVATASVGASAVVHLAGALFPRRPDTYQSANLDTVRATVTALKDSGVRRVVFLSYLGADETSTNPYLRYKAHAEGLIRASGIPAVVFRAAHIFGTPDAPGPTVTEMLSSGGRPVTVLGPGIQRYDWIARDDVAEALLHAALDHATPTGTFELAGPQSLSVDEFVTRVNGADVRIRHLPATLARLLGRVLPTLPSPLVDVMLRDCLSSPGAGETAALFGATLHRLDEMWPAG